MKNIIKFLVAIFILSLIIFAFRYYQNKNSWTLLVCASKMANNIECDDISYQIPDFKSEKECLLEGASKFSKEGFECGKGCKKDGELNICSVICNKSGCK